MDGPSFVMVFQSVICLILLLVIVCWLWPGVRLDAFREQIFTIRAELFDYAASGKIRFDHRAYRLLRQSMNGHIRYAHQLSFFRLCMALLIWGTIQDKPKLEWTEKWIKALNSIEDEQVKKELASFHSRTAALVAERLVLGSPILVILLVLCVIAALFYVGWKSLGEAIGKASTEITSKIVDPRLLDEEAARSAAPA